MYERNDLKMGFLDFLFKKDEEEKLKKKPLPLIPLKSLLDILHGPAPAEPPPLSSYKVQPGDNLWDITKSVNRDPSSWPKLYEENKQIIGKDPNLIFPNQQLSLAPILPKLSPGPRIDLLPKLRLSQQQATEDPIPLSRINNTTPLPIAPLMPTSSTWDQIKAGDIKSIGSKIGTGLEHGLHELGSVKMDRYMANSFADKEGPLQSHFKEQRANQQKQEEWLKANPIDSVPAMLGEEITRIPLWMAGEGLIGVAGKGLARLSPRIASTAEKFAKVPSFVKGGMTDATAYGTVVAPTQSIQEGGSWQDLLDKEKQLPGVLLGGVAARGVFKGIGEGTKLGRDVIGEGGSLKQALAFRKLNLPDELKSNPLQDVQNAYSGPTLRDVQAQQYENIFADTSKPLITEQLISLRPPLRGPLSDAEMLAQRQLDAQGAFGGPLNKFKLKQTIKPGQRTYETRQAELNDVFKDLPIGSMETPVARNTLQGGIDRSMGIGRQTGEYQGLDTFGRPLKNFKKNTDTQDAIAEISTKMTRQLNEITKSLKQADVQTGVESIRKKVKDMGGIRQANDGIFEERRVIPNWVRNDRTGRPLDEVADTLGMNSDELLVAINDSNRKIRNYAVEAQAIANKDIEYLALDNTLQMLKRELPQRKALDAIPPLKVREGTKPTIEPLPIQPPRKLELSGTLPLDVPPKIRPNIPLKLRNMKRAEPIADPFASQRILPEQPGLLTWDNRSSIPPAGPAPIRSITEQSLVQLPKGPLSPPLKNPTGKLTSPTIKPTSDAKILIGPDGKLDFTNAIPQGPIKPMRPNTIPAPLSSPTPIPKASDGQITSQGALHGPLKPIPVTEPVGIKRLSFPDTVAKGDITSPELAERLKNTEMNYGNITNKDTLEVARKFIQDDKEAALHLVMSDAPATAESNAVAQLLIQEANNTQKFDQAISIIEKTATKAKTQGQAIQALSMWGRLSPEGVLKYASNTLDKSKTLKQTADLNNSTKGLTEAMGKVNVQALETIAKEVESGLVPKLSNKPVKVSKPVHALSDDLIKKLDGIEAAARERIASRRGNLNSLPVDLLADYAIIGTAKLGKGAVKFSKWSADMLKEFGDEIKPYLPKIWDQSQKGYDDFARGNGIKGIDAELTQVNRSVGQGLKDMDVSIGDIVRQHYSVGNKVQTDLVTQLVEKAGLSGGDAAILEKHIMGRMSELTNAKKEQILNQIFKPRLAPKQKEISQKIIELSNFGGFQEQKYKALVGEKLGIPSLDEATAKSIYEQSNRIQTMADGREKEVAIAQMLDTIASKIPPTMLQKIATLQTVAQLLNPKTAARNIIGNLGFAGMENVSNTLGAGIDKGVSLITKQRTRTLPSLSTQLKGGREGFRLGLEDAMKGISTTSTKTQFDLSPTKTFRSGPLGKLETAMNIELRASDRAFYKAAYDDSLRGQMKLAKAPEPTEAMKEIADHDGLYKTFQDTNVLSTAFSSLKKLLNDPIHLAGKANHREPLAFGLGDLVIKYPKTPGNLLARGIDYSPAGFVKVVMEASKPLMGKEFNQRAFVDAFSRAIVGTGSLVGTGALLHRVGILSSKRNSDYDVAALERQVGLGEYKVNASALKRFVLNGLDPASSELQKGDTLVSWDWFQPQALPIAMGADIDANGSSPKGFIGTLTSSLATGLDTFADQPITQGIKTLVGGGDLSDGLSNVLQGVPASFVPTLLNQVKQLLDNQKRNTYSPNWIEKTTSLAVGKIPMIEKRLQPTYDALGNKAQTYQDGSNNPLNVFLNPAFVSKYSPSKEAELALNAFKQTGETKQIPTIIPKYFTVTGQRFDLSSEEYATMQRIVGENTNKAFGKISPSIKTDKQIDLMAQAIEKARVEGKKAILNGRGVRYVQSGSTLKLK